MLKWNSVTPQGHKDIPNNPKYSSRLNICGIMYASKSPISLTVNRNYAEQTITL